MDGYVSQEARILAWMQDFEVGVVGQAAAAPHLPGASSMEVIPERDESSEDGLGDQMDAWGVFELDGTSRGEDGDGGEEQDYAWDSSVDELLSEVVHEYIVTHPPRRRGLDFGESPHSMKIANELRAKGIQEKLETMGKKHKSRMMTCLSIIGVGVGLAATIIRG